jgi:uncharacterized protein (TIGR03435 family)
MAKRIAWSLAAIFSWSILLAQNRAGFEVASVRPNTLDDRIVTISVGPGARFTARGYTLVLLIQRAYGVMDWNVTGGPPWIRADRFDIAAKANLGRDLTESDLRPMLQRLLAERFKLRVHHSSKEMQGYALVQARGGAKVAPSANADARPDTFRFNADGLSGQGISMPDFARFVAGKLGLIGADETGLQGLYDVHAGWKLDPSTSALPNDDRRDELRYAALSAIEDQLGLKFTHKRITIPTIVIDQAEKASGDEN